MLYIAALEEFGEIVPTLRANDMAVRPVERLSPAKSSSLVTSNDSTTPSDVHVLNRRPKLLAALRDKKHRVRGLQQPT